MRVPTGREAVAVWHPEMRVARIPGPSVRIVVLVMLAVSIAPFPLTGFLIALIAGPQDGPRPTPLMVFLLVSAGALGCLAAVGDTMVIQPIQNSELRAGYTTSADGPARVPRVDPRSNRVIRLAGEERLDRTELRRRLALVRQAASLDRVRTGGHGDLAGSRTEETWAAVIRDADGSPLRDGDTVVLLRTVRLKGSDAVLQAGTRLGGIRLAHHRTDDRVVSVDVPGVGRLVLRPGSVRKA
ncbi:PhnA domain-containing protein [Promicromonospora sp. MS192]|uniref:PhnA domain-containing protein n=1 Tax=Promicromonospora sp. MS192 TaxID=3412684 RepID=UPI003C2E3AA9